MKETVDQEEEFLNFLTETEKMLPQIAKGDQAIAVKTAKGNIYSFANRNSMSGDHTNEEQFLQMLISREDTKLSKIVCQWSDGCVGVTSTDFSLGIIGLNSDNEDAEILLQGFGTYLVKKLKATLPKKKPERYNLKPQNWTEQQWEQEYESLLKGARELLNPQLERNEIVVLRTAKGNLRVVEIPDYWDWETREQLENQCIRQMAWDDDTQVIACLSTADGQHPSILSWNFRSGLIALNEDNLKTESFLWGGGEDILVKPFSALLPPKKNENQ